MGILQLGDEFFHADGDEWTAGQTAMTKLIVALLNFAKTPDKWESTLYKSSLKKRLGTPKRKEDVNSKVI
jgi:hypothetical protein